MSEPVNVFRAQDFVDGRFGRRAGTVRPLGAGEWSRAYAFSLDGRPAAIRFGAHGEDFLKDRAMGAFRSVALPIPRVWEVGRSAGGWYAVAERLYGRLLDELDGAAVTRALPALFRALDALRAIPVPHDTGFGLWTVPEGAPHATWREALVSIADDRDRLPGWRSALERSPTGRGPFDAAHARLTAWANDLPDVREVVHGDLLYHNVLVQGAHLSAVLDWGNALYGDALYDLAWLVYWWRWYPAWRQVNVRAAIDRHLDGAGALPYGFEHRLRAYLVHIGLDAMAYNAFTGRFDELAANAAQTLALIAR